MCSYNKINGVYASENHWLLTTVLRDEWGYEGLVVSDWGAVDDRVAGIAAGTNHLGHFALVTGLLALLKEGKAHVTTQISVAANQGAVNWDDINWERGYSNMGSYSSSKIATGLLGMHLHRLSEANGWGIQSNLSHPGVSPTNLLSAQPGMGRTSDTTEVKVIRVLSRIGIAGTPQSATLPAVLAATSPDAKAATSTVRRARPHRRRPRRAEALLASHE